ncbi:helix-hairpin-helix domain-containing protein [Deltaproteobacteria bacterium]|nr:helix-hairpin-helix domain-containing protein [Deltaproteobacteria bacterium]
MSAVIEMAARNTLDKLIEANEAYRNAQPIMSDAQYDKMEDRLRSLIAGLDPKLAVVQESQAFLSGIGAPVQAAAPTKGKGKKGKVHWVKAKHQHPMGSLNKAQVAADLHSWASSCSVVTGLALCISDKCDGISIGLYYTDGDLTQAITRGDGEEGEDITRNVVKMKGVQTHIKGLTGFIRGEIVLRKSDWKTHFPTYSNPRNAASGIAKRLDGTGSEHLTVLHYTMVRDVGTALPTKSIQFRLLERLGCEVPRWAKVASLAEVEAYYQDYIDTTRESLDYDIDGLVIDVDDTATREALGDKNHRPKGAVAYKFPHEQKVTVLRHIRWQVGNSGRVTPVAEFDVVNLAGANVKQASLHNLSNIATLAAGHGQQSLFEGDHVLVSRRNDVIPYVEATMGTNALVQAQSDPNYTPPAFSAPTQCPTCGHATQMDGEYLICPATLACPSQVEGSIKRWVTKLGLLGWGNEIIETLVTKGHIKDPADLYTLDPDKVATIDMKGRRIGSTAHTLHKELHGKGKLLPLSVFVGSLGIPLVARSMCSSIVDAGYETLDLMRAASVAEIAAIPGMGTSKAESFVAGLAQRAVVIDKLIANGVKIKAPSTGSLKGSIICMTGFRDLDMTDAIEAAGGRVAGISRKTTLLVAKNPNSTSGKAKKAASYNIEIIGPDEMWTRLGGRP